MKILALSVLTAILCSSLCAQNLIGMDEKEIKNYMKENLKGFNLQDDNNTSFSYVKYIDNQDNQTILFFLTDKAVCSEVRIICDLILKNEKIKELNSLYGTPDNYVWTEKKNNNTYLIELKDEKWFFSINIKLKE
jgi:hypothetical protein